MLSPQKTYRRSPRRNSPLTLALWANAVALVLIALALFAKTGNSFPNVISSAMAQNQLPIGGGAGVFIVPAQFNATQYGCYIMDVDAQTICAYVFIPGEYNLQLKAARSFKYDRLLGNFNTSLSPDEVRKLVEKEKAAVRGLDEKRPPLSPEKPEPDK